MRKSSRNALLDKAHVWTVRGLMGITVLGIATIGSQLYQYYSYIRPARLAERRQKKEEEIVMEQEERELELIRRQHEAEKSVV